MTVTNLTVKPKIRSWIKEKRNRNQHTEYDDCWDDEEENSFLENKKKISQLNMYASIFSYAFDKLPCCFHINFCFYLTEYFKKRFTTPFLQFILLENYTFTTVCWLIFLYFYKENMVN